jgi:hypothetical protein
MAIARWPVRERQKRRQGKPEAGLQKTILTLCIYRKIEAYRLNTGAMPIGEGDDRRFIRFGFPGCPDIMIILPDGSGRTLWVETKSPDGRLSPKQIEFRDICQARNVPWVQAKCLEDLDPWIKLR